MPSKTVIEPPDTGLAVEIDAPLDVAAVGPDDALPDDEAEPLLHAAASAATAIPMQAVRADLSRNLTAFTYS